MAGRDPLRRSFRHWPASFLENPSESLDPFAGSRVALLPDRIEFMTRVRRRCAPKARVV
jgi:hypothetical protein